MSSNSFNLLQMILLYGIPLLFAITLHEVAHGWVAYRCGDPTAKLLGRLTVNPLKHIDIIGTVVVPAILVATTGFIFGWAKPVPVNWGNLHHQRRDVALVALAGPAANLLMALLWAIIIKITMLIDSDQARSTQVILAMSSIGLKVNIILMVLNLIPIPPLDGSRVITSFISPLWAYQLQRYEQYGFILLVVLLVSGILNKVMMPVVLLLEQGILKLVGLG